MKSRPGATQFKIERSKLKDLLALVRRRYPGWTGFSHPQFLRDEIDPKQATIRRARELLGEGELQDLLDEGGVSQGAVAQDRFDEFLRRLETIGEDNNLLWRKVPGSGDLGILYHPSLDKPTFCLAVFDLLYGKGNTPARLERYLNYVRAHKLPNKWTFPTYFLFVCHPETEVFVKPATIKWFLTFLAQGALWKPTPTAAVYTAIRNAAQRLKEALKKQDAHDMADIQSLLWTARAADTRLARTGSTSERAATSPDIAASPIALPADTLPQSPPHPPEPLSYTLNQCAADTSIERETLAQWIEAIERKGQAILYGPPGTGKTFLAAHIAQHLASCGATQSGGAEGDGFWEVVQFHPAYAYEDFMQGIRPQPNGDGGLVYPLVPGRFLEFCRRAAQKQERCILVIDEINRADVSQVFGELLFLLEYRNQAVPLAGGGQFHIPANVRILGTMNTANRSIALLDQALRRRFAFLPVQPNYQVLRRFHTHVGSPASVDSVEGNGPLAGDGFKPDGLIAVLEQINEAIGDPHQALGITFFLVSDLAQQLEGIWRFEIEPFLEDYFFDRLEEVEEFRWERVKAVILP